MNLQDAYFELDEGRGNLKNISGNEQSMALEGAYNDLYEDDSTMLPRDICAQLYYRTADIYVKRLGDLVNYGEKVLIARPGNENLVVLREKEYNEMEKAWRNVKFFAMDNKSA